MAAAQGWHSRGYLPHFDSPEIVQHVVIRTRGSLPPAVMDLLPPDIAARRRAAGDMLDRLQHGNALENPVAREIVEAALLYFDGIRYRLLAWCVMPNHLHAVMEQAPDSPLGGIVKSWKTFTTLRVNAAMATSGPLWALDYFDRYVRSERQLANTIAYVEANPVRAGLVKDARDWQHSSARLRT